MCQFNKEPDFCLEVYANQYVGNSQKRREESSKQKMIAFLPGIISHKWTYNIYLDWKMKKKGT